MSNYKKVSCKKCHGFGWWPIGDIVPIGRMDAHEWAERVIKCPWCSAGFVDHGDKYKALVKQKELDDEAEVQKFKKHMDKREARRK